LNQDAGELGWAVWGMMKTWSKRKLIGFLQFCVFWLLPLLVIF
jgi:hypothetical protein